MPKEIWNEMKCGLFNDPFDYYGHIGSGNGNRLHKLFGERPWGVGWGWNDEEWHFPKIWRRILWFCSLASNSLPRKVLQTSLEKDLIKFAIPFFPWGSPFSRNSFPLNLLVFTQLSMHISIIMPLFATSVVPPKSEGNEMLLYRLEQWLNAKFRKILLCGYATNVWNYFGKWVPSYLIFSIQHFAMFFYILTCTIKGQKKPTVL